MPISTTGAGGRRSTGDRVHLFQAILLFLFPLGVYCLVLAHVNRAERPLMLSGATDILAMLAAGSGFFLVLLPTLFDHLYRRSLAGALGADESFTLVWARWWILWVLYYLFLVNGALLLLAWRRHKTVVYNVDTELFLAAFAQAAHAAGLKCHADADRPGHTIIVLAPSPETAVSETLVPAVPSRRPVAEVEIEPFPAGCHVTLHWATYLPSRRADIERELKRSLEQARATDNPLASWFLVISGLVFGLIALVVIAVYLSLYLHYR